MPYPFIFAAFAPWQSLVGLFTRFLEWLFTLTMKMGMPSYILAILIFTIIIKVLLQPLMNKQMRSTRGMQRLQPELAEIRRRYPNDQQKQNQATMDLYKKHNVKPAAGCLPLLIQFPILIALYQGMLRIANNGPAHPEYFSIPWFGGTELTLSSPDPTWFLPIATALFTVLQQVASSTNLKDKTQRMMLIVFPIMFLFMVRTFPSMMAFYWIFYSIIGTLIYLPFRYKWAREDKKYAEEAAARAAEEAAQREAKKEQIRLEQERRLAERRAKAAKRTGKEAQTPPQSKFWQMIDDPDYDDLSLSEEELAAEKEFRLWLREQGVSKVKTRHIKLHPWSEEETPVELCYLPSGTEVELSGMRAKYEKAKAQAANAEAAKSMFGGLFGKKK